MMLEQIALMRRTIDGMIARKFGRIVDIMSRSVEISQTELASRTARAPG